MSASERELIDGFAQSIYAKVIMDRDLPLTPSQRSAVRSGISQDLKKCSDSLTPLLRPPAISMRAGQAAAERGVDLTAQSWQSQPRFDLHRATFHLEHVHTVNDIREYCLTARAWQDVAYVIDIRLVTAWILKTENALLDSSGQRFRRDDPRAAYAAAGISLMVDGRPPALQAFEPPIAAASLVPPS